ncbi:uncharacterized protein K452DRAFT_157701 [Aplosporella prunicola CBS 121167]|uniref:Uncharacterized protein n=1 Tax=Aplosporella prunicola CBS 121167 TaxID=1176127 RepID=A0A6A6AV28_9PEZI|nr:uncharacterized protein K452DRAFT_157701 [Aplosporella prunicola CBS 121167]KAF2135882.1 hypothetical protein K452DRAFT_157701 [Aplosporella prunicola CBS 121167]
MRQQTSGLHHIPAQSEPKQASAQQHQQHILNIHPQQPRLPSPSLPHSLHTSPQTDQPLPHTLAPSIPPRKGARPNPETGSERRAPATAAGAPEGWVNGRSVWPVARGALLPCPARLHCPCPVPAVPCVPRSVEQLKAGQLLEHPPRTRPVVAHGSPSSPAPGAACALLWE